VVVPADAAGTPVTFRCNPVSRNAPFEQAMADGAFVFTWHGDIVAS